jgi:glycerol uptake facilitator-like aquaporin
MLRVYGITVPENSSLQNAAPLAIGLSVAAGIFAEGPFTGGTMNPARTVGASCHPFLFIITLDATPCSSL